MPDIEYGHPARYRAESAGRVRVHLTVYLDPVIRDALTVLAQERDDVYANRSHLVEDLLEYGIDQKLGDKPADAIRRAGIDIGAYPTGKPGRPPRDERRHGVR